MTCETIPFEPEHFEAMELSEVFNSKDAIRGKLASIRNKSGSYLGTITFDGKPVAIIGLNQTWTGVAEVWTMSSDEVKSHPVVYFRTIRGLLEEYSSKLNLHRIQMSVRRDNPYGQHLAVLLGFRNEGILRQFGPDKSDYLMFGRVS